MQPLRNLLSRSLLFLTLGLTACSGGGSSSTPAGTEPGAGGDFLVLRSNPPNNGEIFLNDPLELDFTNALDGTSLRLDSLDIRVFDLSGNPLSEQVFGLLSVADAGPDRPGRRLVLTPRFPTNASFDDGSFRPGRRYIVSLVGGKQGIKDFRGQPLKIPFTFQFTTVEGTLPRQLFRDTRPGGPVRTGLEFGPLVDGEVSLNRFSMVGVEVRLSFDQPLNPSSENLPLAIDADPEARAGISKGNVFLEYDDGARTDIWIPATVDLERNSTDGSDLVLRPIGLLPNNARVRVIVEPQMQDLSGQSNEANVLFQRLFGTFSTASDFVPQFDALIEAFDLGRTIDHSAPFLEPEAEMRDGLLSASFDFEGIDARLEYEPSQTEVFLNTDFTQITPKGVPPINVAGGVFRFAKVTIKKGTTVTGTGSNPMVWLVNGDFIIDGTLTVDGNDGVSVSGLNAANIPTGGGAGNAGGGAGGLGSPNPFAPSLRGEDGRGPGNRPGGGGRGGRYACIGGAVAGSGGGGGSFSVQGDPHIPPNVTNLTIPELRGIGGPGIVNSRRTPLGGEAGPKVFKDFRADNDFWGSGVNLSQQIRIRGELLAPIGGSGGGGGGDASIDGCSPPMFTMNSRGGGGGGGAGVLIIKALGKIIIGEDGHINANGGLGGGGEAAGSNTSGGGGGGGSGGMVVLMAGQGMDIHVHSNTNQINGALYGFEPRINRTIFDSNFAISADGGICTQGNFGIASLITGKYPPQNRITNEWNQTPLGGFGGMGLIQLMVPPGNDADETGNRLDDLIRFFWTDNAGVVHEEPASRKKLYLAWRGWPNAQGVFVDDDGKPTNIGDNEGDIRPSPVMLPAPFGALSRARSRWIDMGVAARRKVTATPSPGVPRTVVTDAPVPGPDFQFAGTRLVDASGLPSSYLGYGDYKINSQIDFKEPAALLGESFEVLQAELVNDFRGAPAYRLTITANSLLAETDLYSQHRAELRDGVTLLAEMRILSHDDREIYLATEAPLPPGISSLRVLAKFYDVETDGSPGFGSTFDLNGEQVPVANVRIGFAFHTDPASVGGRRFPLDSSDFVFNLQDQALLNFIRINRPTFVKWDVLFNGRFHPTAANNNSGLAITADIPLPSLKYLLLPFRF